MIAVSGVLVLVAFVTLVVGIFQSGLELIYVSIAASVLAGVSLATGVLKTRPKAVAVGPEPLGTWGATATVSPTPEPSTMEEPAPITSVLSLEEPSETAVVDRAEEEEAEGPYAAPAPAARTRRAPAAAKKAAGAAKKAPAKKAAASRSAGTVVVIPGRDKYHKNSCRYAKGEATQTIAKATAKKEGYVACGVCKP